MRKLSKIKVSGNDNWEPNSCPIRFFESKIPVCKEFLRAKIIYGRKVSIWTDVKVVAVTTGVPEEPSGLE